jgi:hypothetical protein
LTLDTKREAQPAGDDGVNNDAVLSIEVGGKTVGARLEAAIASGQIVRRPDGKFELRQVSNQPYIGNHREFGPCCEFLNEFIFTHIYGKKAVPIGCRDCYKVKVVPETLRQLIAVNDIAQGFSCSSKSGSEVDKPDTQSLYASYFYLLGLDKARAVYRKLRAAIDAHPKLGPKVKVFIKRGCTNYEHACGPSDRYTFDPRLAEIEGYFWSRFARRKKPEKKYRDAMVLMHLIRTAYRIGDDSYKDFTDGKDLFPPTVTYDPDEPEAAAGDAAAD